MRDRDRCSWGTARPAAMVLIVGLVALSAGPVGARDLPGGDLDLPRGRPGQLAQSDLAIPPPPPPPALPGQEPSAPIIETAPAPDPVPAPAPAPVIETAPSLEPEPAPVPAPALAPAPVPEPAPLAGRDLVMAIQQELAERGYDPGPADGLMGTRTANAIRRFQSDTGLPADGAPSQGLYQAILAAEPANPAAAGPTPTSTVVAPEAPALAPQPETLEGSVTVLDTANLVVAGQVVALAGVVAQTAPFFVRGMEAYITSQGGTVSCRPAAGGRYRCRTRTGYDIAEAAILNGAARASDDAPAKYREAERKARAGRVGI